MLAAYEDMSEAQHKDYTKTATESNNNLLTSFRNMFASIRDLFPERASELKVEHDCLSPSLRRSWET